MLRGLKSYLLYSFGFFLVLEIMIAAAIYWWPTFEDNAQNIINIASRIPVLGGLATTVKEKGVSAYVVRPAVLQGLRRPRHRGLRSLRRSRRGR